MIALPQEVRAPNVSSEVYFCEERMPLEFTDIHERFDQELLRNTYWHSSTLLNMKRLGKYFDAIAAVFDVDFSTLKSEPAMLNATITPSEKEELGAYKYVRKIRGFYLHAMKYMIIIPILAVINWQTSP